MLLYVTYKLRESSSVQEFLRWSREQDIPATRNLPAVRYFNNGQDTNDERAFIEFIEVDTSIVMSVEAWNMHVASHMPKRGQEMFAEFVDLGSLNINEYRQTLEPEVPPR